MKPHQSINQQHRVLQIVSLRICSGPNERCFMGNAQVVYLKNKMKPQSIHDNHEKNTEIHENHI